MNKEIYEEIIRILLQYISGLENENWHLNNTQEDLIKRQCKHDTNILSKPHSDVTKLRLFLDTFNENMGSETREITKAYLIVKLKDTGQFTDKEAEEFIQKALQNGQIYERKEGVYA